METFYYCTWQSPVGALTLVASDTGLAGLEFGQTVQFRRPGASWSESKEKLAPYRRELEEYFAGRRRRFTFPLDLRGTAFQKRCWEALLEIPYGETRSYAAVAHAVGRPKAFRAVGTANHSNPIAIVVPCHRVIASDGSLGGYGGGLLLKARLLELERSGSLPPESIPAR